MEDSWLYPKRAFDVLAFLQSIRSPRLRDVPEFAQWIGEAAREHDLRAEWLLSLAQKEQSFLTRPGSGVGWQRALDWTMGYGATEGGDIPRYKGTRNQIFSAAAGLRGYLRPGGYHAPDLVGKPFKTFDEGSYTPRNVAEACALLYTPRMSALRLHKDIWRHFNFTEEENMVTTGADVAAVARRICGEYKSGNRGGIAIGRIHFELHEIARCSEFVRECCEAAAGTRDHGPLSDKYFGRNARATEQRLKGQGKGIPTRRARAGDIVCFNRGGAGAWGHIGIWLDNGRTFAENTSSAKRGPGFVVSDVGQMPGRISGTYRLFEPGQLAEPRPFRVSILGTYLPEDAAELRDGATWVRLNAVAPIAGLELFYRRDLNKVFAKAAKEKERAPT